MNSPRFPVLVIFILQSICSFSQESYSERDTLIDFNEGKTYDRWPDKLVSYNGVLLQADIYYPDTQLLKRRFIRVDDSTYHVIGYTRIGKTLFNGAYRVLQQY